MEIFYEVVVKPSYKKTTRSDANHAGHRSQLIGEAASSKNQSDMIKLSGKCKQRYVYRMRD